MYLIYISITELFKKAHQTQMLFSAVAYSQLSLCLYPFCRSPLISLQISAGNVKNFHNFSKAFIKEILMESSN